MNLNQIQLRKNIRCLLSISLILLAGNGFSQTKPNILWVTIEDTSPHFIGCYGNQNARTPNIDQLAKEGVRFSAAFSTNTVCSPSRTTLITGVRTYETGTGNHRSKIPIPDFMHGFPYYMQKAGYYTTNNSKTDYNITNEKAFIADAWNESSKDAGWWKRKPGQPFFAVFNYTDSHQSRTMTDPYSEYKKLVLDELPEEERIKENEFDLPPFYRDSPEMRKQFARVYNALKLTDNKIGQLLDRLKKDNLADSTIIFFYGDHGEGIPRGKTNGINLGYRVPFVVYFPPMYRHLSPWGEAGVVTDELVDFEDLAPTLISMAGGNVPDYMKGRVLMGSERSAPADHLVLSSDRSDNGIDMIRSVTDGRYMYSRNYLPFMPEARYINYMEIGEMKKIMRKDLSAGLLNPLQKSLFDPRPAEFLFDVEKDVWETANLADDPQYKSVLEKMRKKLDSAVIGSRDVMFLPEYEIDKIKGTPYEFKKNEANYPLETIYAAARLSGFRDKDIAEKQIGLLKSPDNIVRYWAITGLRSQNSKDLALYKKQLMDAMNDKYPPVVITASAIVYAEFEDKTAEDNLKKYLADENSDLALMTGNYLLYMENKNPFAPVAKSLLADKNNKIDGNVKWMLHDFLGSLLLTGHAK